jgi:hypothetical protein
MLVDSMTPEEVRNELLKDKELNIDKFEYGWNKKYKSATTRKKSDGLIDYKYITTDKKNTWLVVFYRFKKRLFMITGVVKCNNYGKKLYLVANVGTDNCIYECTPHFFDRFRERAKIEAKDIMVEFILRNALCITIYENDYKGSTYKYICIKDGVCLGNLKVLKKYYIFNTFINSDMLKETQEGFFLKGLVDIEEETKII